MQETLKAEAIRAPRGSLAPQQRPSNVCQATFDDVRPQGRLGGRTPTTLYPPSPRPFPQRLPAQEYPGHYLVKRATITDPETGVSASIEERLRLYTKRDLLLMFESVGLRVAACFGDYGGNEFVEGVSDRVIMLCEKP